jgi:hypothetical protein
MNIDVDVDDVLWSMSSYEKKEMLKALIDDMDLEVVMKCLKETNILSTIPNINSKLDDDDFNIRVMGLINNRFKLTTEEEDFIIRVSERINP